MRRFGSLLIAAAALAVFAGPIRQAFAFQNVTVEGSADKLSQQDQPGDNAKSDSKSGDVALGVDSDGNPNLGMRF